jgi:hypothetical protein
MKNNISKFKLAVTELYNPYRHGFYTNIKQHHIYGHHIIHWSIDNIDDFYNDLNEIQFDLQYSNDCTVNFFERIKYQTHVNTITHPIIRNFENIVSDSKQFEIQIIEPIYVSVGNSEFDKYSAAIVKTHWIRLIQRKWREIRQKRLNNRKNIFNIKYKEIHGKLPNECNIQFKLGII